MTSLQLFSTNSLGNWVKFVTSTGNFTNDYTVSFPTSTDTVVYETFTQNMSNKTFTSTTITDDTNTVTAKRLGTAAGTGFDVSVDGTVPSGADRLLVTTSSIAASWSTVPNAALSNSSITINTASPGLTGGGLVSLGGTLNLANGGVTGITYGVNTRTGNITFVQGTNITITDSPSGTFNFNVPAGAGGVSSFSAGTTGLTPNSPSTGAITLGGTLIAVNGGTGFSSYAIGDLLYADTTTTLAKLASAATGNVLLSGTAPSWGKVSLTTAVSGILPIANGGTALSTTPTNGQLLIGNGTNYTLSTLTAGTGVTIANGAGSITVSLNPSLVPVRLSFSTSQVSVGGAASIIGYIPWQNSSYSSYTTRTIILWVIPSSAVGKNLTVSVSPGAGAPIGSIVINGGAAVGAIYTFTFTNPGVDVNLRLNVSRTGGAGNNPLVSGATMSLQ